MVRHQTNQPLVGKYIKSSRVWLCNSVMYFQMMILSPLHMLMMLHVVWCFRNFTSDTSSFTLSEADVALGESETVLVSFSLGIKHVYLAVCRFHLGFSCPHFSTWEECWSCYGKDGIIFCFYCITNFSEYVNENPLSSNKDYLWNTGACKFEASAKFKQLRRKESSCSAASSL